jgi:hypothetical protein
VGALLGVSVRQIGPVPTDQLPSLQLDPTTLGAQPTVLGPSPVTPGASWVESALMDGTPTIMEGPSHAVVADLGSPFAADDEPVEDVPDLPGLLVQGVPLGLRIDTLQGDPPPPPVERPAVVPPPRRTRRALPGFGPLPAPRMPFLSELPSVQGD